MGWVDQFKCNGKMWATPGPYLRQSMLKNLARQVSGHFMPEEFYKEQTFSNKDDLPAEEEERMVTSLKVKIVDKMNGTQESAEDLESLEL